MGCVNTDKKCLSDEETKGVVLAFLAHGPQHKDAIADMVIYWENKKREAAITQALLNMFISGELSLHFENGEVAMEKRRKK